MKITRIKYKIPRFIYLLQVRENLTSTNIYKLMSFIYNYLKIEIARNKYLYSFDLQNTEDKLHKNTLNNKFQNSTSMNIYKGHMLSA